MEMALSLRNNRTYGAELVMPMNASALDCEEMEYVEGGGTISLHIDGSTLAGWAAAGLSGWALSGIIDSALVGLATTVELGSAGTGTLVAATLLSACAWLVPALVGLITSSSTSSLSRGVTYTLASGWMIPFNFTIPL